MATELTRPVFETQATDPLLIGKDALMFVMANGDAAAVPTAALALAEKAATISIARRDTPDAVLARVNCAVDEIAAVLRTRLRLDTEAAAPISAPGQPRASRPNGGAGLSADDVAFVKALREHLGDNLGGGNGGGTRVPRPIPPPVQPPMASANRPF
jgi:hypothetical protein